jgi:hypothetical protein
MDDENPASTASERSSVEEKRAPESRRSPQNRISKILPYAISIIAVVISLLAYFDQHHANQLAEISAQQAYAQKASFWTVYQPSPTAKLSAVSNPFVEAVRQLTLKENFIGSSMEIGGPGLSKAGIVAAFMPAELYGADNIGVRIDNLGAAPISNVDLVIKAQDSTGSTLGTQTIDVGTIPPCSIANVNSAGAAIDSLIEAGFPGEVAEAAFPAGSGDFTVSFPTVEVASMTFTDSLGSSWVKSQNGTLSKYTGGQANGASIEYANRNDITAASGCS